MDTVSEFPESENSAEKSSFYQPSETGERDQGADTFIQGTIWLSKNGKDGISDLESNDSQVKMISDFHSNMMKQQRSMEIPKMAEPRLRK